MSPAPHTWWQWLLKISLCLNYYCWWYLSACLLRELGGFVTYFTNKVEAKLCVWLQCVWNSPTKRQLLSEETRILWVLLLMINLDVLSQSISCFGWFGAKLTRERRHFNMSGLNVSCSIISFHWLKTTNVTRPYTRFIFWQIFWDKVFQLLVRETHSFSWRNACSRRTSSFEKLNLTHKINHYLT